MKRWRNPSDQKEPADDNEDIEMTSMNEEQAIQNQEDGLIIDQRLMFIICKPRKENSILSKKEVKYLRSSYEKNHTVKSEYFYQYIHDFADYKSGELIIDQCWSFERELHKPADLESKTLIGNPNIPFSFFNT